MKKNLLLLLMAVWSLSASSQTLSNTTWSVYDTTSTFYLYFRFGADTLSYSSDNIAYTPISTYQEAGTNFSVLDVPGPGGCVDDTGNYTFLIQNDTLKFTLISDLCPSRPLVISTYHWTEPVVGIQNVNPLSSINIFPNPTRDVVSIQSNLANQNSKYIVFDQFGRSVLTGTLTSEITLVDLHQLTAGIYFFQIGEEDKRVIKVIKE